MDWEQAVILLRIKRMGIYLMSVMALIHFILSVWFWFRGENWWAILGFFVFGLTVRMLVSYAREPAFDITERAVDD